MRRKLCIIMLIGCLYGCTPTEEVLLTAPTMLPATTREMKTAGYWISRSIDPDRILMSADDIDDFNKRTGARNDILSYGPTYNGTKLSTDIRALFYDISGRIRFDREGKRIASSWVREMESELALDTIGETVSVRYGFIIHYANQRLLPTDRFASVKRLDLDFDEVQNNALEIATPVALMHQSRTGQWTYVIGPSSEGWVLTSHIIECSREHMSTYLSSAAFVVALNAKVDVYWDEACTQWYDYIQMGTRLPLRDDGTPCAVTVPYKTDNGVFVERIAYVQREAVHIGYLAYTPRTIIERAFAMLNTPYGWGGMYGEQDCSRFIQQVFATVGIDMPRNSAAQAALGLPLASILSFMSPDDKAKGLVYDGIPGATLLGLRGHIMIYLGNCEGHPYAIHATWAYREPGEKRDQIRLINRVAVTDLTLGTGSQRGSLLARIQSACVIRKNSIDASKGCE